MAQTEVVMFLWSVIHTDYTRPLASGGAVVLFFFLLLCTIFCTGIIVLVLYFQSYTMTVHVGTELDKNLDQYQIISLMLTSSHKRNFYDFSELKPCNSRQWPTWTFDKDDTFISTVGMATSSRSLIFMMGWSAGMGIASVRNLHTEMKS